MINCGGPRTSSTSLGSIPSLSRWKFFRLRSNRALRSGLAATGDRTTSATTDARRLRRIGVAPLVQGSPPMVRMYHGRNNPLPPLFYGSALLVTVDAPRVVVATVVRETPPAGPAATLRANSS